MYEDYLYHHGVKGMKWGVRRNRISGIRSSQDKSYKPKLGGIKGSPKQKSYKPKFGGVKSENPHRKKNREIKQDRKQASKNRKNLSDAELNQRINRLEKERKLKTLTDQELKPGRTATKKFLKEQGSRLAGTIIGGAAAGAAAYYVKKKLGGSDYKSGGWEDFFREMDKKRKKK